MNECHMCGERCEGTTGAIIDGKFRPMCHQGPAPTCYQRWSWRASESDRWQTALALVEDDPT